MHAGADQGAAGHAAAEDVLLAADKSTVAPMAVPPRSTTCVPPALTVVPLTTPPLGTSCSPTTSPLPLTTVPLTTPPDDTTSAPPLTTVPLTDTLPAETCRVPPLTVVPLTAPPAETCRVPPLTTVPLATPPLEDVLLAAAADRGAAGRAAGRYHLGTPGEDADADRNVAPEQSDRARVLDRAAGRGIEAADRAARRDLQDAERAADHGAAGHAASGHHLGAAADHGAAGHAAAQDVLFGCGIAVEHRAAGHAASGHQLGAAEEDRSGAGHAACGHHLGAAADHGATGQAARGHSHGTALEDDNADDEVLDTFVTPECRRCPQTKIVLPGSPLVSRPLSTPPARTCRVPPLATKGAGREAAGRDQQLTPGVNSEAAAADRNVAVEEGDGARVVDHAAGRGIEAADHAARQNLQGPGC